MGVTMCVLRKDDSQKHAESPLDQCIKEEIKVPNEIYLQHDDIVNG